MSKPKHNKPGGKPGRGSSIQREARNRITRRA